MGDIRVRSKLISRITRGEIYLANEEKRRERRNVKGLWEERGLKEVFGGGVC